MGDLVQITGADFPTSKYTQGKFRITNISWESPYTDQDTQYGRASCMSGWGDYTTMYQIGHCGVILGDPQFQIGLDKQTTWANFP